MSRTRSEQREAACDFDKPAIRALATLAGSLSVALQNSASYQALAGANVQMIAARYQRPKLVQPFQEQG